VIVLRAHADCPEEPALSTLPTTADGPPRGHRGPRRLAIAGFLLFASGAAAAAAASVQTVQNDGIIASFVGDTVSTLLGMDSSGGSDSKLLMAVLIIGFMFTAIGLSLMFMAMLWSIARLRLRHRAAKSWDKMEPAVSAAGRRGRKALGTAADHTAPVLNEGTQRARSWMSKRRGTPMPAIVSASTPEPAVGGLTTGDPLGVSVDADPNI
jgi:hypothetical protein